MIIALAGRRIDAPDAESKRFPVENVERVRKLICEAFTSLRARALVCAAACGADILALEIAGQLGLRRRIVLPCDKESFKRSSVTDRLGDWGARYDQIISEVEAAGDLIIHDYDEDEEATYFAANHDILDAAEELAMEMEQELLAIVVWDGTSRGEDDVTDHFLQEARQRGLRTKELNTLNLEAGSTA